MAKGKKSFLGNIIKWVGLGLNLLVLIPLLLAFLAGFIPPGTGGWLVFCGIGFPFILLANAIFILIWLPIHYPYCLISLIAILLNINNIDKIYQFKGSEVPEKCHNAVTVMSYNAQLFGLYQDEDMAQRIKDKDTVFQYIREVQPDILCFQEYFWDKSESLHFHTTDSILQILNLNDEETNSYQFYTDTSRQKYFYGLAVFSKYKIVDAGPVYDDGSSNAIIYTDIKYKGDTLRIYNVHLTSMHFNQVDYNIGRQLISNTYFDPAFDKNAKKLFRKIALTANKRRSQADTLRAHMDSCPYPIIVCGDFNEPPTCYCYNHIAKHLKDTFRESGEGEGLTYVGSNMPHYRIDNILYDSRFLSYGHTIGTQIMVSDHYPISATLSINLKKR